MTRAEPSAASAPTLLEQLESIHAASHAWARACAGDPADAADVLQSAYEKVLDGRARFDGRSALKTWMFGVIRRTALENRRRAFFRTLGLGRFGREPNPVTPAAADRAAEASEAARAITAGLAKLAARQREVLHLVFYEGLTVEAAAAVMGVGVGSARVHYDRGKKRLAALLEEKGIEP